jgi:hypothetical protein
METAPSEGSLKIAARGPHLVLTNPGCQAVSTKHATLGLRPTPKRTRIHRHRATSHPPAHCWTICQLSNSQQDADLPNAEPDIRRFFIICLASAPMWNSAQHATPAILLLATARRFYPLAASKQSHHATLSPSD